MTDIEREDRPTNAVFVQAKISTVLAKLGLDEKLESFRLFFSDGVSYNILAVENMSSVYPNLVHMTCVSHMISRVLCQVGEEGELEKFV